MNAQDGGQLNRGGGSVFNKTNKSHVDAIGEQQGSSLCNSNCIPMNIVDQSVVPVNSDN